MLTGGTLDTSTQSKKRKSRATESSPDGRASDDPDLNAGINADYTSFYRPFISLFLAVGPVNDPGKKILSQHKVRTNAKERTLDSMFPVANPAHVEASSDPIEPSQVQASQKEIKESECYLASVKSLRQAVLKNKHKGSGISFYPGYLADFHCLRLIGNIGDAHFRRHC
jgi:hypothetical protein